MKQLLAILLCFGLVSVATAEDQNQDKKDKKKGWKKAQVGNPGNPGNLGNVGRGKANHGNANLGNANQGNYLQNRDGGNRRQSNEWQRNRNRDENVEAAASVLGAVLNGPVSADVEVRGPRHGRREVNRGRNISRRGPSGFAWSFGEARQRLHRGERRDRSWYRSNYNRFALFAGGYYYWDRGYWYPAYGYDPEYSSYEFDEPIYGYNGLEPGRVITNVQNSLQEQGYYDGDIDGLIGPQTRSALGLYQRELGLEVTRSIDGPTLAALGLN